MFHLAFPVYNLREARKFYVKGLGFKTGRQSTNSLILNLGGNQIVAQLTRQRQKPQKGIYPRHFGLIFKSLQEWERLVERVRKNKLKFYQAPKLRYSNTPLEHRTFFLQDPSHNLLEFKFYKNRSAIFGQKDFKKVGEIKR